MSDQAPRIIVVGVDAESGPVVGDVLARYGVEPEPVASAEHALRRCREDRPAAVVVDGDAVGLAWLCGLRTVDREVPVLVLSSKVGADTVVEAMGYGVAALLRKPLVAAELAASLGHVLDNRRLAAAVASLKSEVQSGSRHRLVMGSNPWMMEVARLVERAADTDATVLVQGETGTGKDLVARVIHDLSGRRAGPFVKVNCAGPADGTLESELFGFERGAFSGAVHHKPGKLDFAHHGTLFLDEVAAMGPSLQRRLLLVLQEGAFWRMGGVSKLPVDARLVVATSADIEAAVAAGTFREDLFFRLNVVSVRLPPLRERREDILPLARHFLGTLSVDCNNARPSLADDTWRLLAEYDWPGNVRELQNIARRLVVPGGEAEVRRELQRAISARALPASASRPARRDPASGGARRCGRGVRAPGVGTLKEIARAAARAAERAAIFRVLQRTRWNRKAAAEFLGISYKALLYKIRENGLDKPAPTS